MLGHMCDITKEKSLQINVTNVDPSLQTFCPILQINVNTSVTLFVREVPNPPSKSIKWHNINFVPNNINMYLSKWSEIMKPHLSDIWWIVFWKRIQVRNPRFKREYGHSIQNSLKLVENVQNILNKIWLKNKISKIIFYGKYEPKSCSKFRHWYFYSVKTSVELVWKLFDMLIVPESGRRCDLIYLIL